VVKLKMFVIGTLGVTIVDEQLT